MKTNTIKYSQAVWKSTIIMVLDLNERKALDQNPDDPSLNSFQVILFPALFAQASFGKHVKAVADIMW